jgi:flavin-dependent dehydrogenase
VLIVGAGPAGAVAATVLARAGARVRIVDRADFPRDKLCGDTVNPGTLGLLRRLEMATSIDAIGLRVEGMVVTGESGIAIEARYPVGRNGRALTRAELDWMLLQDAIRAGARFQPRVIVKRALVSANGRGPAVEGVAIQDKQTQSAMRAKVTIAADGRRSTLAFGLGLARHPLHPRRWAIGGYFDQVAGNSQLGEMHIRRGRYIGVAPVTLGRTNVCLVRPSGAADKDLQNPAAVLRRELDTDPLLRDRFLGARAIAPPVVLGPLAVDVTKDPPEGLILAGDAAGFVDPMTGDGLRFAVRGGELAACAALRALEHGWDGVHQELQRQRRAEFVSKWRFNRALRALVGSPFAVRSGTAAARLAPAVVRAIVLRAGDCDLVQND